MAARSGWSFKMRHDYLSHTAQCRRCIIFVLFYFIKRYFYVFYNNDFADTRKNVFDFEIELA